MNHWLNESSIHKIKGETWTIDGLHLEVTWPRLHFWDFVPSTFVLLKIWHVTQSTLSLLGNFSITSQSQAEQLQFPGRGRVILYCVEVRFWWHHVKMIYCQSNSHSVQIKLVEVVYLYVYYITCLSYTVHDCFCIPITYFFPAICRYSWLKLSLKVGHVIKA